MYFLKTLQERLGIYRLGKQNLQYSKENLKKLGVID